jgi:hypothetical protein
MLDILFCRLCNKEMEIGTQLSLHLIQDHPYEFLEIFYKYYSPSQTGIIDSYFEIRAIEYNNPKENG